MVNLYQSGLATRKFFINALCKSYRTRFYSLVIVIYTALKDNRPVKRFIEWEITFFDLFKLFYIYFIFMQTDNTLLRAQSPAALPKNILLRYLG